MARIAGQPRRLVAGATVPDWLTTAISNGWTQGRWAQLTGSSPSYGLSATTKSTIDDARTTALRGGPNGIITAFTGAAFASGHGAYGTYVIGQNGGNGTYHGNDVFGVDMETREFVEICPDYQPEPDEHQVYPTGDEFGEYRDGTPLNGHQMSTPAYLPDQNAVLFLKGTLDTNWFALNDPNPVPYGHILSLSSTTYSRMGSLLDLAAANVGQGRGWRKGQSGCWVSSIERYFFNAMFVSSSSESFTATYDPVENIWDASYPLFAFTNEWQNVIHDPKHDRIVLQDFNQLSGSGLAAIRFRDASNLSGSTTTITQTGDIPSRLRSGCWLWSPNLEALVYWHTPLGKSVYAITPDSGTTWPWSKVSDDTDPFADFTTGWAHGQWNKPQIATYGSYDLLIMVSGWNESSNGYLYALRLT